MGRRDIVIGGLLAALSALVFGLTFRFPHLTVALSPTVFPRFVSGGLFVFSVILVAQGARKAAAEASGAAAGGRAVGRPDRSFVIRFVLLAVDALAYVALLEPIGYVFATPVFIAVAMLIFGERRWHRMVLVSVIATVVMYGLFRTIFRVPLPRSILW